MFDMKKILISIIVILTPMISFAQNQQSQHLSFKGVPIDGTLNGYVAKMKQSGFTTLSIKNDVAMLKGDFAGYKDCVVYVATLKEKDLVSKITVIFPEHDTWSSLEDNYLSLKAMLTEKYGEPSESVEEFSTYSEPKNDYYKIHAVKFDEYKYFTTFETIKGSIQLSIEHDGVESCFAMLSYYDKINSDIIKARAIDDL